MKFSDRISAGRELAALVAALPLDRPVVIGLARGGVPVAREVAARLGAELDVMVVRKIGAPGHREFAIGALARGTVHLDDSLVARTGATAAFLQREMARETAELDRREQLYRRGRPAPSFAGRTVVLVDDGIATGASARVAIDAVRRHHPARLVLAVPVCAPETARLLRPLVDDLIAVQRPEAFTAVGNWYEDFSPTGDREVLHCLDQATGPELSVTEPARRPRRSGSLSGGTPS